MINTISMVYSPGKRRLHRHAWYSSSFVHKCNKSRLKLIDIYFLPNPRVMALLFSLMQAPSSGTIPVLRRFKFSSDIPDTFDSYQQIQTKDEIRLCMSPATDTRAAAEPNHSLVSKLPACILLATLSSDHDNVWVGIQPCSF